MKIIYEYGGKAFAKISRFMSSLSLNQAKAIGASVIVLAVSCFAVVAIVNPFSNSNMDLTSSLMVGESSDGARVLEEFGCGGIVNPYNIIVEFNQPIACLEKTDESYGVEYKIIWDNNFSLETINEITDCIYDSDKDNISDVAYLFRWDYYLAKAPPGDALEKINFVIDMTYEVDPMLADILERTLLLLILEADSPEEILDMGGIIDYAVNTDFGLIGFQMIQVNGDVEVISNHVKFIVSTNSTSTSVRTVETTQHISDAMGKYVRDNDSVSNFWMGGSPVTYGNIYKDVSGNYVIFVLLMLVIMFFVMWAIERDWRFSLAIIAMSVVGFLISLGVLVVVLSFIPGGVYSLFVFFVAPIVSFSFGIWYGHIGIATVSEQDSLHRARKNLAPLVIVTAVTIVFSCIPFMMSSVKFISQIGLMFAIIILVDTIAIRILLSPSVWTLYRHYFLKE